MADEKLVLYGNSSWTSPYVFSTYVVLKEKGLDFEMRLLDLARKESLEPSYRDPSLTGRVPALVHGDFWLSESSAIDEYLEETFPAPRYPRLYPAEPRDRARARQIQAWLRSDLAPIREERSTEVIFMRRVVPPLTAAATEAAGRLLRAVERVLAPGAAFLFNSFSVVDADVALMLQRLITPGDPVPERLRAYAEAIWRRPSVRSFVEQRRPAP